MALLTLTPERVEKEMREAAANDAADRASRRRLALTLVHAGLWWALGMFLILSSWATVGRIAQALFAAGWVVGNVAPLLVLVLAWLKEDF